MNKIIIILASLIVFPNIALSSNLDSTTKCKMNNEEKSDGHCTINPLLVNDSKNKAKSIVNNNNGTVTVTNKKASKTITPPRDKEK